MRILLLAIFMITCASLSAQLGMPGTFMNRQMTGLNARYNLMSDSTALAKKWSFSKYGGISTGFSVFNGGTATMVSAPVGLQLNRRLTNDLFAFAGLSAAPSFVHLNSSFRDFNVYKTGPGSNRAMSNGFGIYSRAEAGLMYINDERTFSISGSIGIDRSSYPAYYQPLNRGNPALQKQLPMNGTR